MQERSSAESFFGPEFGMCLISCVFLRRDLLLCEYMLTLRGGGGICVVLSWFHCQYTTNAFQSNAVYIISQLVPRDGL